LLRRAEFRVRYVEPRYIYADAGNPGLLDGMVHKIIVPMTETAREEALRQELMDDATWKKGIGDLERTGYPPEGTFFYTWFKGEAVKVK